MIRQADETAGEERRDFLIYLRLCDRAARISDAGRGPRARHPLSTVIITAHAVAPKFFQQGGVGSGDLVRVKGANGASTEIDDVLIFLFVGDAARVSIMSDAAGRIDIGVIGDARAWWQFQRPAVVDGTLDQGVVQIGGGFGSKFGVPLGAGRG